jgi:hypothetical protein
MSVLFNQRVGRENRLAGAVQDRAQLVAWLTALSPGTYPHAARLLSAGVSDQLPALEKELLTAFLDHGPATDQRPHVEALLLAMLGREPEAEALGFAEQLPSAATKGTPPEPLTILKRAVQVGERTWAAWPEARRRREYLLLEFYDAILTPTHEDERDARVAACLRLLLRHPPQA